MTAQAARAVEDSWPQFRAFVLWASAVVFVYGAFQVAFLLPSRPEMVAFVALTFAWAATIFVASRLSLRAGMLWIALSGAGVAVLKVVTFPDSYTNLALALGILSVLAFSFLPHAQARPLALFTLTVQI